MCGLVGVFGKIGHAEKKAFTDLLWIDTLRGGHSTGVAILKSVKAHPRLFKALGPPDRLYKLDPYKKGIVKDSVLLMGHNRLATKGVINIKNAHPFRHGDITLTHNGTVNSMWHLPLDYKEAEQFDTDSETICYSIEKHGIDETWKGINGAAALVYWDRKEKALCIVNNGERSFHWAYSKDKEALIYASEAWMIRGICARNGIELEETENGCSIFYPTKHKLFKFRYIARKKTVVMEAKDLVPFVFGTPRTLSGGKIGTSTKVGGSVPITQGGTKNPLHQLKLALLDFPSEFKCRELVPAAIVEDHLKRMKPDHRVQNVMDKAEFDEEDPFCDMCGCDLSMSGEYEVAVAVDPNTVICGNCATILDVNDANYGRAFTLCQTS